MESITLSGNRHNHKINSRPREAKEMTEVTIPQHVDVMDQALFDWEVKIAELEIAQLDYLQTDSILKAWEASTRLSFIEIQKMSATMADSKTKASQSWLDKILEVNKKAVAFEKAKRLARVAEARWETERSKQVSLRNVK